MAAPYKLLPARHGVSYHWGNGSRTRVGEIASVAILLLIPFIGLLWVPFYNQAEPALFGFPFFYWYQLLWVPISSLLTFIVWRAAKRTPKP